MAEKNKPIKTHLLARFLDEQLLRPQQLGDYGRPQLTLFLWHLNRVSYSAASRPGLGRRSWTCS